MTVATLRQALTPQQIAIGAAFFHDGETQEKIAERFGVTQGAVSQTLATLKRRAARHNLPQPRRFRAHFSRTRQLHENLYRSL